MGTVRVGGHTIPSTLARFDHDIAAWKPTVVSIELGMNDRATPPRHGDAAFADFLILFRYSYRFGGPETPKTGGPPQARLLE